MRRRALAFLLGSLGLSACVSAPPSAVNAYMTPGGRGRPAQLNPQAGAGQTPAGTPSGRPIAVLLPLTGPMADRGQAMLKAAQLAMDAPGAPPLDVRDTTGTADGALIAAQGAITAGDGIIVGPLTNAETAAVAGPAQAAHVPVLAFTSDPSQARPGVWVLGLTPGQQVRRLVASMQAQGALRFAALLPETEFGRLMGAALSDAVSATGGQPPTIRTYGAGMSSMTSAVHALSDFANRRGAIDAQIKAARDRGDADGRAEAAQLATQTPPPPPFDALLLADTGTRLNALGALLVYDDVNSPPVRLMGPALWGSAGARAGSGGVLNGAFYAAPDPAARTAFVTAFNAKFQMPPAALTDLVFDAASLARVVALGGGDLANSMLRPEGFAGADGVIVLLPDGHVQRGLAVFRIDHGNATIVEPAPQSLVPGPQS